MSPEDQFIATIVKYIALTFLGVVALGIGSCQASKYQMRMALDSSQAPMAVKCALVGDGEHDGCALLYSAEAERLRD